MKNGIKLYFILMSVLVVLLTLTRINWAQEFKTTGNPDDTGSGTIIKFKGRAITELSGEVVSYKDSEGTQMETVEASGGFSLTVTSEFGISHTDDSMPDESVDPGDILWQTMLITMEGNAEDSGFHWWAIYDHYAGASNWIVEKWIGEEYSGTFFATLEAGISHETSSPPAMPDDVKARLQFRVLVPTSESDAPNGSYIIIYSTVETESTPVGEYTGANKYTYGGTSEAEDSATDLTSAPVLTLSRASTVDAPTAYTGGEHDAVPGAVITFTITYSNEGASDARYAILIDKIPDNTKLAHVNTTGTTTNVNITAPQQTADDWNCWYSILDNPDTDYSNTSDWEPLNDKFPYTSSESFPGGGELWETGDATYEAKWIRFRKGTIEATEDTKSITWGVTIR